jgi:hypothetical protein
MVPWERRAEEDYIMAKCQRCGTETQLYFNGIPICLNCSDDASDVSDAKPKSVQNDVQLNAGR